jgi:hypothetical protein
MTIWMSWNPLSLAQVWHELYIHLDITQSYKGCTHWPYVTVTILWVPMTHCVLLNFLFVTFITFIAFKSPAFLSTMYKLTLELPYTSVSLKLGQIWSGWKNDFCKCFLNYHICLHTTCTFFHKINIKKKDCASYVGISGHCPPQLWLLIANSCRSANIWLMYILMSRWATSGNITVVVLVSHGFVYTLYL